MSGTRAYVHRVLLSLSMFEFLASAMTMASRSSTVPWMNYVTLFTLLWGLVSIAYIFVPGRPQDTVKSVEVFGLVFFSIVYFLYVHAQVLAHPYYNTDELAFDQYAGNLFVHGQNPYTHSMLESLTTFRVPQMYWTFTIGGQVIDHLSYPSLSFLFYVPFLKFSALSAPYVDALFWIVAVWLMYVAIPHPYKSISLFVGASLVYINYIALGLTDGLFIPFLIILAWKWEWVHEHSKTKRWLPPAAIGVAMAIKQTAWFLFPVAVIAVYKETKSLRKTTEFLLVTCIVFLLPNLYFIIMSPTAWIRDIMGPFVAGLLPAGQGIISLPIWNHVGGGYLPMYTVSAVFLLVGLLFNEWVNYDRIKGILFILPSIVLFFPMRSFGQYMIDLFPVFIVSVWNLSDSGEMFAPRKRWSYIAYVPFAILLCISLTLPSPLEVTNVRLHYSSSVQGIDQVAFTLENNSRTTVQPRVLVYKDSTYQPFWKVTNEDTSLNPGMQKTYTLVPKNATQINRLDGGFYVDVLSSAPKSISASPMYVPARWRTDVVVQGSTLTVQVVNADGTNLRIDNFPVYIEEINNATGSVVTTLKSVTNSDGIVSIHLTPGLGLVYQAYLEGQDGDYGYSGVAK